VYTNLKVEINFGHDALILGQGAQKFGQGVYQSVPSSLQHYSIHIPVKNKKKLRKVTYRKYSLSTHPNYRKCICP
jgi:hypothetical protein